MNQNNVSAGIGGFFDSIFPSLNLIDGNTEMVAQHFWPNGDFDIYDVQHRIRLGIALVRINNGMEWKNV